MLYLHFTVETENSKLKRRIFWLEENQIKIEEHDKVKAANAKLVKDNEKVKYDFKTLNSQYQTVNFKEVTYL